MAPETLAPHAAKLPAWTFWEPVDVPVLEGVPRVELPLEAERIVRTPAADARRLAAKAELRDAVASRGFAVTQAEHPVDRLGDFYAGLRDAQIPWVITLDALFFAAHLALERAHAEAEASIVVPSLTVLLRHLDARLAAGSRDAAPDLAAAHLIARGLVAVALALADPAYKPAPALAGIVDAERARIIAHSAVGVSPWLGVPLDYSAMAPVGQADRDELHAGWFRAVAWARGRRPRARGATARTRTRSEVDVGTARAHARAALLLARALSHDVDHDAETARTRVDRVGEVLVGRR